MSAFLHFLFFISGTSGLVYQVIWVRQFGNLFGNTVHSASLVTAVFMLGLGFGSYFLGQWTDKVSRHNNQRNIYFYGIFEILIGLWGIGLALLFPHIEGISSSLTTYSQATNGWYEVSFISSFLKYGLATSLVLPSTFLMGGTLPLLIRYSLHHNLKHSAQRVASLYGVNTLGAALGAILVDFFLIPSLGLKMSQGLAVIFNIFAGVGALCLLRWSTQTAQAPEAQSQPTQKINISINSVFGAIFIAGFLGMGLEILWFRHLSGIMGSYRMVFSLLLFVILIGIWFGAWLGGYLVEKGYHPKKTFAYSQSILIIFALISVFIFQSEWHHSEVLKNLYIQSPEMFKSLIEILQQLRVFLFICFIPAVCMGTSYPLANSLIQNAEESIGRRAGGLYFANTFGGVLGSLAAGFLLIPLIGLQNSFILIGIIGSSGVYLLLRRDSFRIVAAVCTLSLCLFFVPANYLNHQIFAKNEAVGANFIKITEGPNETVAIGKTKEGDLLLFTNGHKMSGASWQDQRYMGAFSHIPLLQIDKPQSALVICFGVGNTLYSASLHGSIEELHIVDLSKNILNHHSYFKDFNHGVLNNPKTKVFINDGRQHLRIQSNDSINYDLITLEPPPMRYAGTSSLYSKEFYELAKARLNNGGFITQWLPINQIPAEVGLSMVKAFIEVFPNTVLLNGYYNSLMLMGRKNESIRLDKKAFMENLKNRPAVEKHLKDIYLGNMTEIVGSFVSSFEALKEVTQNSLPQSDNRPTMEYSHIAYLDHFIPKEIFNLNTLNAWCEGCQDDTLDTYLSILNAWYSTNQYLQQSSVREIKKQPLSLPKSAGNVPEVIKNSAYLSKVFGL